MNRPGRTGAVLALAVAVAQGTAATAQAAQPASTTIQCGETITSSITVANDLTCTGTALYISADNVTVNLGGHVLTGNGTDLGIMLAPSPDEQSISGASVTNGTVEDFATAVQFVFAVNPTLSKLTLDQDGLGDTSPVLSTRPGNMTDGLQITHSSILGSKGLITDATIEVYQFTVSDTTVDGGEFFFSQTVGGPTFTGDHLTDTTLDLDVEGGTTITGSKFVDSPIEDGGAGYGYDTFQGNTFTGAGTALAISQYTNEQILDNTFTGNDIGIDIYDSFAATINGNTFTRNATAGLYYEDDNTGEMGGGQATVDDNLAQNNGKSPDGLQDPEGQGVSGGLYLYTASGGATVDDNHTSHNSAYGIYALPSTQDLNYFSGNISTGDLGKCYPLNFCTYE